MNEPLAAPDERRSEPRKYLNQYRSVELDLNHNLPLFQFQLRDISPSGLGVLVNADSEILNHLEIGQIVDMQYNPKNPRDAARQMKTQIQHITHMGEGRFSGHYLVGFAILEGD